MGDTDHRLTIGAVTLAFRRLSPAWWTWRNRMYWRPTIWGWPGGRSASFGPLVVARKEARNG